MREFAAAIQRIQQQQEAYLKAVIHGYEVEESSQWTLSPDGSRLMLATPIDTPQRDGGRLTPPGESR